MRRLTRGRAATDDEAAPPANGASEAVGAAPSDAQPRGDAPLGGSDGDAATTVLAPGDPATTEPATSEQPTGEPVDGVAAGDEPGRPSDLPAGVDADELSAVPLTSAGRSRLRRRLRYLRGVRELLLRDLGGFYAEAHRSEPGADGHRRLLDAKARRLATLDAEVRELEGTLSEPHPEVVLREPGIGGTCPECGELHGSEARFCGRCGAPLTGGPAHERGGAYAPASGPSATGAGTPAVGADGGEEMTTASLWGRRHAAAPEPSAPESTQQGAELTQAGAPAEPEPAAEERPS